MKPALRVEMTDFEQVWGTVQNLLLHPFENNLYHFVPILGAFTWGHTPIVAADCGQASMIPKEPGQKFSYLVETLRKCANLSRKIDLYTALTFHFSSFGGKFSCPNPIIVIPYHRLFRPDGSSLGDQTDHAASIHERTDSETKFYIAREIAHIKFSDDFIKTAARVAFLATLVFLYATPLSLGAMAAVFTTAVAMVLFIDRIHEYAIDRFALLTLAKDLGDPKAALGASVSSLEKERMENIERRAHNRFCRFYITSSGNNLLDLAHPFLTSRIEELQRHHLRQIAIKQ